MEWLILLLIIGLILGWSWSTGYKAGKREGSRKGYGVGFDRGRRASESGCLVMLALAGSILTLVASVLAKG